MDIFDCITRELQKKSLNYNKLLDMMDYAREEDEFVFFNLRRNVFNRIDGAFQQIPTIYLPSICSVTGGPTMVHQVAYRLRLLGYKAKIFFYRDNGLDSKGNYILPSFYQAYSIPIVTCNNGQPIKDGDYIDGTFCGGESSDFFIFNDAYFNAWFYTMPLNRKIILLMSVPNSWVPIHPDEWYAHYFEEKFSPDTPVLCQCAFIRDWVLKNVQKDSSKVFTIWDYLTDEYTNTDVSLDSADRQKLVLYNPNKDAIMNEVVELSKARGIEGKIQFIPLTGYTAQQLVEIMKTARLYVDFGFHPGMDRLPRECAALGCCVLTGRRGSANFYEDVPIDDVYKIDDRTQKPDLDTVLNKIIDIVDHYDDHIERFEDYRRRIYGLESEFENGLRTAFNAIAEPNKEFAEIMRMFYGKLH